MPDSGTQTWNNTFTDKTCGNCFTCPLRKHSLFDILDNKSLELLLTHKTSVSYQTGENLYKEGNKVQGLICLKSGKLKEYKTAPSGNKLILSLKRPVEFVGLSDLLLHSHHHSSVMALEDAEICIIDKGDFMQIFRNSSSFAQRISVYLARLLEYNQNHLMNLTQKHMRGRLAYALLYLKDYFGERQTDHFIDSNLKRSDMAALTNLTTANVIRTLSSFSEESLIEIHGRDIRILDHAKVQQVCELN